MSKMMNTLDEINSRLDIAEERNQWTGRYSNKEYS